MPDQQQTAAPDRKDFWRGVFSDGGSPSSSRILTAILSLGTLGVIVAIVVHLIRLEDPAQLSLWLTALPGTIFSLVGLACSPYAVNRTTGSLSDFFQSFRNK